MPQHGSRHMPRRALKRSVIRSICCSVDLSMLQRLTQKIRLTRSKNPQTHSNSTAPTDMAFSLHTQISPPCAPATKIRLSMLAKAMVDALGGPAEFSRRFSFEEVRTMIPNENFGLPPGVWTDDTSMALCLGQSLVEKQGFDEEHQLELYMRWRGKGYLSATGVCFDVGNTISTALFIYANSGSDAKAAIKSIAKDLGRDAFSGESGTLYASCRRLTSSRQR